jgi:hypothetical protein
LSATRARSEIARRSLSISDTGCVVTKQLIFDLGGHDKIGATAYANLDRRGTQQKIQTSRKARIAP